MGLKESLAEQVVAALKQRGLFITTVESCTGGGLANALTDIPGASEVFAGGFITYSNEQKYLLGVPKETLARYTVYSCETAQAMAVAGLNQAAHADMAIGITGSLSRVDPANAESSVPGEVYLAVQYKNSDIIYGTLKVDQSLGRPDAKNEIIIQALNMIYKLVQMP